MRNPFVHRVGGVVSADIAVPEYERELKFYSGILTTGTNPLWREDLLNNDGNPVIGLGQRNPEYEALPLQWMPHFQVADVSASVAYAMELGGRKLMQDEGNQWAVLTDQNGAAFGIIPVAVGSTGNERQIERIGCIAWLSFTVPNAASSCEFYRKVVGWNPVPVRKEDNGKIIPTYEMQIDPETVAAEIGEAGDGQLSWPPVWLIYLLVDDLDESLRLVSTQGGEIIAKPANGMYAIVRDPVGVYLALQAGSTPVRNQST